MNKDFVVQTIKHVLGADERVVFAYLFGSVATGKNHEDSDVDIAVYFPLN